MTHKTDRGSNPPSLEGFMDLCDVKQIKNLLGRHGFQFSKAMGQNFLTAAWVPQKIAEASGLDESGAVLEIGPGIGCLTVQLSKKAGKVVAVELDRSLEPVLSETLAHLENTEVIFGDVLKLDLKKLAEQHMMGFAKKPIVCANLPYNITSPAIAALIDAKVFGAMTLMVQREVAKRICAKPGTADYGAFTVYVNMYTEPEILFDVSPACFMPQPKVWSSVISLRVRDKPKAELLDEAMFFKVVRSAFNQRRKTLVNALASGLEGYSKERLMEIVVSCGHDKMVRGEKLDIHEFSKIANTISKSG